MEVTSISPNSETNSPSQFPRKNLPNLRSNRHTGGWALICGEEEGIQFKSGGNGCNYNGRLKDIETTK